jgi:uncharacterized protein (DUF302 family)
MKNNLAALLLAFLAVLALGAPAVAADGDSGLMQRASPYPVAETLDRLEAVLLAKGIKIFARIDHAGEAQGLGLDLPATQLLIFGNPKAGTPLMQAAPTVGLDLPMKVLAWQDARGEVHVTWNSPAYLIERYGLEADYTKNLSAVNGLIDAALK